MSRFSITKSPGIFNAKRRDEIKLKCAKAKATIPPSAKMDMRELPSLRLLSEYFDPDFQRGELRCRKRRGGLMAGEVCGTRNTPYVTVYLGSTAYRAHRILWKMYHRQEPDGIVHHRNGDGRDNRIGNLEVVSILENNRRRVACNNSSGVVGVAWNANAKRWESTISAGSKNIALGLYHRLECAIQARQCAESALFGYRLVDMREVA